VHTLGNLTLSADNARLSNHPFRRKQEILDSIALRMNQWIAAQERWGKAEILARADELAERAINLWPGPIDGLRQADEWPGWSDLHAALVAMPAGTWTTYGDIGSLIGTHAAAVGQHLASKPGIHGAHRVLTSDGRISDGFRWPDVWKAAHPKDLLIEEGVPFDSRAAETSCFPNLDAGIAFKSRILWPIAIYPVSGTVEVIFQPLKIRAPFDDETQRRELMTRFNAIDLAEAKIDLRPSFPLVVLAEHGEDICWCWSGLSTPLRLRRPGARRRRSRRKADHLSNSAGGLLDVEGVGSPRSMFCRLIATGRAIASMRAGPDLQLRS
jgi:alkylated DNA nucleotide flippase Atl1